MKTKYKYIHFEKFKTENHYGYQCLNNKKKTTLGFVRYDKQWKCFIFIPYPFLEMCFSQDCLEDIIDFMQQLKEDTNGE